MKWTNIWIYEQLQPNESSQMMFNICIQASSMQLWLEELLHIARLKYALGFAIIVMSGYENKLQSSPSMCRQFKLD